MFPISVYFWILLLNVPVKTISGSSTKWVRKWPWENRRISGACPTSVQDLRCPGCRPCSLWFPCDFLQEEGSWGLLLGILWVKLGSELGFGESLMNMVMRTPGKRRGFCCPQRLGLGRKASNCYGPCRWCSGLGYPAILTVRMLGVSSAPPGSKAQVPWLCVGSSLQTALLWRNRSRNVTPQWQHSHSGKPDFARICVSKSTFTGSRLQKMSSKQ